MNRIQLADASTSVTSRLHHALVLALLAAIGLVGCGKQEEDYSADVRKPKSAKTAPVPTPAQAAVAAAVEKEARLATAVSDGKTTAPVHLRYDVPTKPDVNQAFAVDLSFHTDVPADSLDVEIADAAGLTIDGDKIARVAPVEVSKPYEMKLQVQGNSAGLYYISVVAKVVTKVQTESRAFAVPIVIGSAPAAEKPEPARDATGQAIQSMPAKEK